MQKALLLGLLFIHGYSYAATSTTASVSATTQKLTAAQRKQLEDEKLRLQHRIVCMKKPVGITFPGCEWYLPQKVELFEQRVKKIEQQLATQNVIEGHS
jgi:hypothetical protein